jgi:hypothetical protein
MPSHARITRTAIAVGVFTIALTSHAAEFGDLGQSRPSAQDMLRPPPPSSSTIYVPVAPASDDSGSGTVYYDDGSTIYGTDGSTATRYGDLLHVVPSQDAE